MLESHKFSSLLFRWFTQGIHGNKNGFCCQVIAVDDQSFILFDCFRLNGDIKYWKTNRKIYHGAIYFTRIVIIVNRLRAQAHFNLNIRQTFS